MKFSGFDHECMALALRLAEKGLFTTHPNPRVGCVIARSGKIIAGGWHRAAGEDHAEIVALKQAGDATRGSTVYVTLEPCAHQGRTSACTEALLEAGVARVVAAVRDPFPQVNGKGLARLQESGVKVEVSLLQRQAEQLNAGFFSRVRKGRPFVRIKSAQSLDGRTALANGQSKWITSKQSRDDVQHWRARSDAILTGAGTVAEDNPRMTVRAREVLRQPLRVVVDSRFRIDPGSRILNPSREVLIYGCERGSSMDALVDRGIECEVVATDKSGQRPDLEEVLQSLARRGINEVHVEAGATLCGALISANLADEIVLYLAPKLLGTGGPPAFALGPLETITQGLHLEILETVRTGPDLRLRLAPAKND